MVGRIEAALRVRSTGDDDMCLDDDEAGDAYGHGTAVAGIIRRLAPECDLFSVRVLTDGPFGGGELLLAALQWAIRQRFHIINLSLSTTKRQFASALHTLADLAYFGRVLIVASAHNMPVESFPWRFASVVSVGSHAIPDPYCLLYNPTPPVEFYAYGTNVPVPWKGGSVIRASGNSFATPHVTGLCALILERHPDLSPLQMKNALWLLSRNVSREGTP
jgi:subtilisin family serine protease